MNTAGGGGSYSLVEDTRTRAGLPLTAKGRALPAAAGADGRVVVRGGGAADRHVQGQWGDWCHLLRHLYPGKPRAPPPASRRPHDALHAPYDRRQRRTIRGTRRTPRARDFRRFSPSGDGVGGLTGGLYRGDYCQLCGIVLINVAVAVLLEKMVGDDDNEDKELSATELAELDKMAFQAQLTGIKAQVGNPL
eukprot:1191585-Prorocentrum_minimum.AAC.2